MVRAGKLVIRDHRPKYPVMDAIQRGVPTEYILDTNPPTTLVEAVLLYEHACRERSEAGSENALSPMSGWWWGARHAREQAQRAATLMFGLAHA